MFETIKKYTLKFLDFCFYYLNPFRIIYYAFFYFDDYYFVLCVLLMRLLIMDYTLVPSCSMYPTLYTGDIVLTSKFAFGYNKRTIFLGGYLPFFNKGFRLKKVKKGCVVAFYLPHDNWTIYCKRVIATAGDVVQKVNGRIVLNGVPFKYTLLREDKWLTDEGLTVNGWVYEVVMPNGFKYMIFRDKLLPDESAPKDEDDFNNSDNSIAYEVPEGHVFLQGDNNLHSGDSFDTEFMGFVPDECIFSEPLLVLFSSNSRMKPSDKFFIYYLELIYRLPYGIYTINKDRFFKVIK